MFPYLIELGPLRLATYGTTVAIGYLIGIVWLKSQIPWMPRMNLEKFWIMIYGLFFGAIMGGKLLFLIVEWPEFASGNLNFFSDFRYGFVFYGGLFGATLMGFLVRRWIDVPYLPVADFYGVALPMGHWLGRIGCFGVGCCYGKPTDSFWGVAFPGHPASSTPEHLVGVPLHPTQLYESAAVLAICLFNWRFVLPRVKKGAIVPGTVFLGYIWLYSVARFFIEFFRGDDRGATVAGLFVSQWLSIASIVLLGAWMCKRGIWKEKR